jgi:hypothetical protein
VQVADVTAQRAEQPNAVVAAWPGVMRPRVLRSTIVVALGVLLSCQSLTEAAVVEPRDFAVVANSESLFLIEGVSRTELRVIVARDAWGNSLDVEGEIVERLELPPQETCGVPSFHLPRSLTLNASRIASSTVAACQDLRFPPCDLACGGVVWAVRRPDGSSRAR